MSVGLLLILITTSAAADWSGGKEIRQSR